MWRSNAWRLVPVCAVGLALVPLLIAQAPPVEAPAAKAAPKRDLAKFTVQQRTFYLSGQRGLDWLQRANKPDGRFVYGFLPALRAPLEGDDYLRQAGAAFALARAAKFYRDERGAAIAKQALLSLLIETTTDPQEKHLRHTAAHPAQVNRLGAAGMLAMAIYELPDAAEDLLQQADQLTNYLREQLNKDGSLRWRAPQATEAATGPEALAEGERRFPGPALYAIIRSQAVRPAAWKLEALRNGRAHYHDFWKQHKNTAMLCWHSAAYAEAFLHTKEQDFAEAIFAMNDWLCGLQYRQMDARRQHWTGGFRSSEDKTGAVPPDIRSATAAESLAEACRVARLVGDVQRHQRYKEALESCLTFLTTLQYTEASAQHFADWYRPALVGGFHASHQDGNLRLDYSQHALTALVQYLAHVAELP